MKRIWSLAAGGVVLGLLGGVSPARGGEIFKVTFDGAEEAVQSPPRAVSPKASDKPPFAHPTVLRVGEKNSILVQDQAHAPQFGGFGQKQFVVMTAGANTGELMQFRLPAALRGESGEWVCSFDYQRDGKVKGGGNFTVQIEATGKIGSSKSSLIGLMSVTIDDGRISLWRNDGKKLVVGGTTNLTKLEADKPYTIEAILNLKGDASTLDFAVKSGDQRTVLTNGKGNTVSLEGGQKVSHVQLSMQGTKLAGTVAVDNVTVVGP